jgi:hypothetical protein
LKTLAEDKQLKLSQKECHQIIAVLTVTRESFELPPLQQHFLQIKKHRGEGSNVGSNLYVHHYQSQERCAF